MFLPPGPHILRTLLGRSILIGRSEVAHIQVRDRLVSALHAVLALEDDKWKIRDLGSRNGTFVNGNRVAETPLQRGDTITVGETSFTFDVAAEPVPVIEAPPPATAPGQTTVSIVLSREVSEIVFGASIQDPNALSTLVNLSGLIDLAIARADFASDAASLIADYCDARRAAIWLRRDNAWTCVGEWGTPMSDTRRRDILREAAFTGRQACSAPLDSNNIGFGAAIPVAGRQATLGAIYLERTKPVVEDELEILSIFATKIGLALENEQLNFELRVANAELSEANTRLEREVARRTAEVQKLSEQRRDLLGMVAHDVRGALSFVTLLADPQAARRRGTSDPVALDALEQIGVRARRTIDILSGLLDAEALAEGRIKLRREAVDIVALAQSLLSPLQPWAQERRIELVVRGPGHPVVAEADRARVEQVLQNLVANALKHTLEGRVEVSIEEVGRRAVIAVVDTGSGIAPDVLTRIFKPFSKTEGPEHRPRVGLGLAIAHRLVEAMGGAIAAESEVGKGTTVRFDLPLTQSSEHAAKTGAPGLRGESS
jgi:signal transduction histidine kinase